MYYLHNVTPITNISKKDIKIINKTIQCAEKSKFGSSKRMAACIINKGLYILRREPT